MRIKIEPGRALAILVAIKLLLPFLLHDSFYQLHRDEYLYLSQGHHLAWGYLETPPIISFIAAIINLLGAGFFWVKIIPVLFSAFLLWMVGDMVIKMGGKVFAVVLACIPILTGAYLRMFFYLHPNFLDVSFWVLMSYALFNYFIDTKVKWLYVFGVAVGLGAMSKYDSLFYAIALLIGLLISPHRKIFATKHLFYAALLAFAIALPNFIWQYQHNFPVFDHMQRLKQEQLLNVSRESFLISQLVINLPFLFVVIGGVIYPFVGRFGQRFRFFVWAWILLLVFFTWQHAKDYYTLGAYPVFFALGAFYLDKITRKHVTGIRIVMVAIPVVLFFFFAPLVMPVSEPGSLVAYYGRMNIQSTGFLKWEDGKDHLWPQDFADMIGWRELAQKCAGMYHSLPAKEQKQTLIYAKDYFSAAAINYYGKKMGLPEAYSDNGNFIMWLPDNYRVKNVLVVCEKEPDADNRFLRHFEMISVRDSLVMPLFRESGTKFLLYKNADDSLNTLLETHVSAIKARWKRI